MLRGVVSAAGAMMLLVACGDGDGSGMRAPDPTTALRTSPVINYDEEDLALDPNLRANPDDIITLRLEDPGNGPSDTPDTGDEPGVDVIPYHFVETMEREVCWELDPGAEAPPANMAPAYLSLQDDRGGEVLRVEQDGPCVRRTIPAGEYRAVFHHGASARADHDLLFILPRDASADVPAAASGADAAPIDTQPPGPEYCGFAVAQGGDNAKAFAARVVNDAPGQPCPSGPIVLPFEVFALDGVCTDLTLLKGRCTYHVPPAYVIGTGPEHFARVYEDVFFRGGRKTIVTLERTPIGFEDFFFISGPASLVVVDGQPTVNRDLLIRTNGCDRCNLSGVNLRKADLHKAWLHLADLSHADLGGANLQEIVGQAALFKSANLVGADLSAAFLSDATFDSAGPVEGGTGQVYPAADLSGAHLDRATLSRAVLRGATLTKTMLDHGVLDGADLRDVSAAGAVFTFATLTPDADLTNATLSRADFTDAEMAGVKLTEVRAPEAIFIRAKMSGANLQGASLGHAKMRDVVLKKAVLGRDSVRKLNACQLNDAYLANATLSEADMTGVNFNGAHLYGTATAEKATLTNANFNGAELSGTTFTGAALQNAQFDNAHCVNCQFDHAHMSASSADVNDGARFNRTDLRGASFDQADVAGCVFTNAIVSFTGGNYVFNFPGELLYTSEYGPSNMGAVTTLDSVICPDGLAGPCNTQERLKPHRQDATPTLTRTPRGTCTPNPRLPCPATWTPTRPPGVRAHAAP